MQKNTGKTETLNYIISRLCSYNSIRIGLTSIGIDGESIDQVTGTKKPEIILNPNTLFITSEELYPRRELVSDIINISKESTSLGRLITANTIKSGKALISGPNTNSWLKENIENLHSLGADLVLVDGAISKLSFGSPSITDAMILTTGASLSLEERKLIRETKFVYDLTQLQEVEKEIGKKLENIEQGAYSISDNGEIEDLGIRSVLMIDKCADRLFAKDRRLFFSGIITDKLFDILNTQKESYEIIIKDFTKVFSSINKTNQFLRKGGRISVVDRVNLIAITVNPTSPSGYNLNSDQLIQGLKQEIPIPIYNIKES